ncbi:MAG: TetR/AcrR family transcriptional regulator [Candidatus Izemoplasmatales bacterium]
MNKKSDSILDASITLLLDHGMKGVTMDDISEQANVSKVTIYKYFTDKDTLYKEVCKRIIAGQSSALRCILESNRPLAWKFGSYVKCICDFTDSRLLWLCGELKHFNDRLAGEYADYMDIQTKALSHLVDEGFRSGMIRRNLDQRQVFHLINMGLVYYQQNEEYRRNVRSDSSLQTSILDFFMQGIFVDACLMMGDKATVL